MDKTLTTAATGLSAQQRFVEVIANNLANVNTTPTKKYAPSSKTFSTKRSARWE